MALYQITLPDNYNLCIAAACAIAFECVFFGAIVVGSARKHTFPQQWLEETFGREHVTELEKVGIKSDAPSKGGYPDMGNGKYSDKLSYENWFKF